VRQNRVKGGFRELCLRMIPADVQKKLINIKMFVFAAYSPDNYIPFRGIAQIIFLLNISIGFFMAIGYCKWVSITIKINSPNCCMAGCFF
jgi:hypothetical protein